MQTILFTGGGSAGHVTPNIALIHKFLDANWHVVYAGSKNGIEKSVIEQLNITYYKIATGKLRRYFSWWTLIEPFAIFVGIIQAFFLCRQLKPTIIFSKGGFVAFPIVVGGWLNRIPIVIHESDLTPGLANKLSFPFADKICVTYEEGKKFSPGNKIVVTGNPIRESLLNGQPAKGRAFCQFNDVDPVLLVLGGGQGATIINETIRHILPELRQQFQIAHVCGKGKTDQYLMKDERYTQFEYVNQELADLFACADLVISRAGANSLYELLCLKKPHILIPLSKKASRGDQIVNADYFAKRGLSTVLYEEQLNDESLFTLIKQVYAEKEKWSQRLSNFSLPNSNQLIYKEIIALEKNHHSIKDKQ